MWDAACEYFEWCDKHPWIKKDVTKKQVLNTNQQTFEVEKETLTDTKQGYTQRPYTLSGLCIYLGCNSQYFKTFKSRLDESQKDFDTVIHTIEEIIYTNKFEGATVGAFNANIIARDLGLSERSNTDITTKGESINTANSLSTEQLEKMLRIAEGGE